MDDNDDGFGSEVNTARDSQQSARTSASARIGDALCSSTPIIERRAQSLDIISMSPIRGASAGILADGNYRNVEQHGLNGPKTTYSMSDYAEKLAEQELKIIRLKKLNVTLENQKLQLRNRVEENQQNYKNVHGEKEKLEKELAESKKALSDSAYKLCVAEQKLSVLENLQIDIEAEIPSAITSSNLKQEYAKAEEKIKLLEERLSVFEIDQLHANKLEDKLSTVQERYETEISKRNEVEVALNEKIKELEKCNSDLQECRTKMQKNAELSTENGKLSKELEEIKQSHSQKEVDWLEKQNDLEKKIDYERQNKEELKKKLYKLEKDYSGVVKEKQNLLNVENNEKKEVMTLRNKANDMQKELERRKQELEKYSQIEKNLNDLKKQLTQKEEIISNLRKDILSAKDDAETNRSEIEYLRAQESARKSEKSTENSPDLMIQQQKLIEDNKRLQKCLDESCKEMAKSRNEEKRKPKGCKAVQKTFIAAISQSELKDWKRNNDSLVKIDELKAEIIELKKELKETKSSLDIVKKERELMLENNNKLEMEKACLSAQLVKVEEEFQSFQELVQLQSEAERQLYQESITELEERIKRLHDRLAESEPYPGRHDETVESTAGASITIWDTIPSSLRSEFAELKTHCKELDEIVHRLMTNQPTILPTSISKNNHDLQIPRSKSTECKSTAQSSSHDDESLSERFESSSESEASSDDCEEESHSIVGPMTVLLKAVKHAKTTCKLTPNIQQLIQNLLCEINEDNKSNVDICVAVDRFFANLDLALKQTLSTSEGNRQQCEELGKMLDNKAMEICSLKDELHISLNNCSLQQAEIERLELKIRNENQNSQSLFSNLGRALSKIEKLEEERDQLHHAFTNAELALKRKTELGSRATETLECYHRELEAAKNYENDMNERLIKLIEDREKIKCSLSDCELENSNLQRRLASSIDQCTQMASEMRHADVHIGELEYRNQRLKRKCDKREEFLEEMESLLKAMKIRCDGLRAMNQLRQNLLDKMKHLMAKLGYDLDNLQTFRAQKVSDAHASSSNGLANSNKCKEQHLPHVEMQKARKLAESIAQDASKIRPIDENVENEIVQIPPWRTANSSISTTPGSSHVNVAISGGMRTTSENVLNSL